MRSRENNKKIKLDYTEEMMDGWMDELFIGVAAAAAVLLIIVVVVRIMRLLSLGVRELWL